MSDHKGDQDKRTAACNELKSQWDCPEIEESYSGMDGERYRCKICRYSYFLDYEDMK